MANNTNLLLNWLKAFQTEWLPENLPNDTHLLESIQTKLQEFEQLIIGKGSRENQLNESYFFCFMLP